MHIRVLLSRYRAYTPCTACGGARLKPDALLWRVGSRAEADAALAASQGAYRRFLPMGSVMAAANGSTRWPGCRCTT